MSFGKRKDSLLIKLLKLRVATALPVEEGDSSIIAVEDVLEDFCDDVYNIVSRSLKLNKSYFQNPTLIFMKFLERCDHQATKINASEVEQISDGNLFNKAKKFLLFKVKKALTSGKSLITKMEALQEQITKKLQEQTSSDQELQDEEFSPSSDEELEKRLHWLRERLSWLEEVLDHLRDYYIMVVKLQPDGSVETDSGSPIPSGLDSGGSDVEKPRLEPKLEAPGC